MNIVERIYRRSGILDQTFPDDREIAHHVACDFGSRLQIELLVVFT